ncbi:hypothetical protein EJD97_015143 [Solanum chilense]|uniref:Uncharacterized protein n=1 Tax=Solanum chilense TaxID=4083 RepID=A0A6N2BCE0_SOLCI|nr:hypothetical protein EJD97_015143 [Solanum chilense]
MENQGIPSNPNRGNLGHGEGCQPLLPVEPHHQVHVENQLGDALGLQPPAAPRLQDYYRGNMNITDSDEPLVLPSLPPGHTFIVTSSLMQMSTVKGLFRGSPSEDPHAISLN